MLICLKIQAAKDKPILPKCQYLRQVLVILSSSLLYTLKKQPLCMLKYERCSSHLIDRRQLQKGRLLQPQAKTASTEAASIQVYFFIQIFIYFFAQISIVIKDEVDVVGASLLHFRLTFEKKRKEKTSFTLICKVDENFSC